MVSRFFTGEMNSCGAAQKMDVTDDSTRSAIDKTSVNSALPPQRSALRGALDCVLSEFLSMDSKYRLQHNDAGLYLVISNCRDNPCPGALPVGRNNRYR